MWSAYKWMMPCLLVATTVLLFFNACKKESGDIMKSPSKLKLYLTDAPGTFQAVWIDIQKVMVHVTGADSAVESGWIEVPLRHPGLYNLMKYRNGKDTLLATANIPSGRISQIRLSLGENNYVILKDGTKKMLTAPSGQQSGLKLNVHAEIKPGATCVLVMDFDAARSVVMVEHEKYLLKPVVRTFIKTEGGTIEGVVLPSDVRTYVFALQNEDTVGSSLPDTTGKYKFWGMPAGSYQLVFDPDTSFFLKDTLHDVQVHPNKMTTVDTVVLRSELRNYLY